MSTAETPSELFINSHHPGSNRFAVFEDDGASAWLYLTESGNQKIVADVWIYNCVDAPPTLEIKAYRSSPPPAAIGYASDTALCEAPQVHNWQIIWSHDGQSVALTKDGVPVGCIILASRESYSKELTKNDPWGKPWSDQVFESYF